MNQNNKDRISIQVGLNGYSFRLESDGQSQQSSEWVSADRLFTSPELQKKYDEVTISVFTHCVTLVPDQFYEPADMRKVLKDVADISDSDVVDSIELPELGAVMVYSNNKVEKLSRLMAETVVRTDGSQARPLPELYHMLKALDTVKEYNKIIASYSDGYLYLVVAQGKSLLLCNSFKACDFTTAEYFIFLVTKKLQLNPEVSSICFRTALEQEQEMSLYRYFKSVETI